MSNIEPDSDGFVEYFDFEDVGTVDVESEYVEYMDVNSEEAKAEDVESEEAEAEDVESEYVESMNVSSEEAEAEDVESEEAEAEDVESMDVSSEEAEAEDVESEDDEAEDSESEESEAEYVESKYFIFENFRYENYESDEVESEESESENSESENSSSEGFESEDSEVEHVESEESETEAIEYTVPKLFKLLSIYWHRSIYKMFTSALEFPKRDIYHCCNVVHKIISENSAYGVFDPLGKRKNVYKKVVPKEDLVHLEFFRSAIKYGHVDCLKMAKELGCPSVMRRSDRYVEIKDFRDHMIYLKEPRFRRCPEMCSMAAFYGQLECLKYFHQQKRPWNILTCVAAILGGNMDCLKYAVVNGCDISEPDPIEAAASSGNLSMLEYLHEHRCQWSLNACSYAAKNGHLECLKYMRANGCPWDESTCVAAVQGGNFECLKYIVENGCPTDSTRPIDEAANIGNLTFLKYLHEHGWPWSDNTCQIAACARLISLKYAHLKKFPGDSTTCKKASKTRNRKCEIFEHLHETTLFNEQAECLTYAWLNGCPWRQGTCKAGIGDGRLDCLLSEPYHNCMWDNKKFNEYAAVIRQIRPVTSALLEPLLLQCSKRNHFAHHV